MATKKAQSQAVFTSIEDYIRVRKPDLHQLYELCHQQNILTPRVGERFGATLVIPPDSEISRLVADSNSTEVAKVSNVCRSLQSIVIRRALASSSDWMAGDVLDGQHPSRKWNIKVSGKGVILADGARDIVLTIAPDFKPAFRNIAVWYMDANGTVNPERGEPVAQLARSRLKKDVKAEASRAKTGGYEAREQHGRSARFRIAILAENEYAASLSGSARSMATTSARVGAYTVGGVASQIPTNNLNPFVTCVASFARYMYEHDPTTFFQAILPLIGFRVIDFYAIFESHRIANGGAIGQYLIPDEMIDEWLTTFQYRASKFEDIIAFRKWVDDRLAEAGSRCPCAIYSNIQDLITEIDSVRADTMSAIQNPGQAAEIIIKQYSDMLATNSLGSIQGIYPDRISQYWRARPCAKLAHDELAFITEPIFCRLATAGSANAREEYMRTISLIGNVMHAETNSDICAMLPLTNARKLASFANDAIMSELRVFVNSTAFMWIPLTSATMRDYPVLDSTSREDVNAIYNVDLALALKHERLLGPESERIARENKEAALAAIRSLRPENMSPELRAHLHTLISQ
ncbi:MAG: hypothetical protein WC919_07845 [Candidatus Paceibacterota bacterium]|jgi:hypothetical protein